MKHIITFFILVSLYHGTHQKNHVIVPKPNNLYSAPYAADRPYVRRGYCHGDFQLCDMMGGV